MSYPFYYNTWGMELIDIEIQKPQLFQSISEKGLGDVKMPDKSMVRTCTNYYLNVKEYNYSGTLINETNTFLYQNCYGVDDGENTEIDWIEDDTPGGGVTDEYEEEKITWGEAISTDLVVNIESSTSSEKRFIAKWKPYTAPGGIYFESYEKINLQKDVFGHWVVQNLDHLSMSAVGSSTNQSIEPILNYAEDTSSQNWASVLLSYKDKRVRLKAGKTVISISDEMKSSRAWGVGDLTSNH